MKKGEILEGFKRGKDAARHPIIFLISNSDSSFIGAVLTHGKSEKYPDNIPMKAEHFMEGYKFRFNDTHLVGKSFVKPEDWGPFTKVGELTGAGIRFIDDNINSDSPVFWNDYIDSR